MNKKTQKVHKQPIAEMRSTETPFMGILKKTPLFFLVMGISFALTVGATYYAPRLLRNAKKITLPSLSMLLKRGGAKKMVFSGNENFTTIDPMLIKEYMDANIKNIVIIDTRSIAEYESGHIKGSISIPLYTNFRSPYESVVSMSEWTSAVKKRSWGAKEVVIYGFNADADIIRVAAETLRKRGIKAKLLSVGYGEWQGGIWNWIAGGELNGTLNINDYIERK